MSLRLDDDVKEIGGRMVRLQGVVDDLATLRRCLGSGVDLQLSPDTTDVSGREFFLIWCEQSEGSVIADRYRLKRTGPLDLSSISAHSPQLNFELTGSHGKLPIFGTEESDGEWSLVYEAGSRFLYRKCNCRGESKRWHLYVL